ncbi:DNA ligase [Thalassotalea euphylliae]|uniref:DNA ligase n=1 Tax=Thalassotalea euphylliae TaxID=1655234 RepID=A0A3E0TWH3_9GAMM|nr:DNA ligase [Thalassotalea euphylliae]REL28345.1 DNA ligase [Thalassotalea euphylliae]
MFQSLNFQLPIILVICSTFSLFCNSSNATHNPLNLQLASDYHQSTNIRDYWVSEKLDGVRGYWDGKQLFTRGGHRVNLPSFFTEHWPSVAMDGELWIKRRGFEQIAAIVNKQQAKDVEWQQVKFLVFDLPNHQGTFSERITQMRQLIVKTNNRHLQMVEQYRLADNAQLTAWLDQAIAAGGEGLMLHKASARYQGGRTSNIMKLKPLFDAEAEVIAHLPGKGKYTGQLGAIKVKTPDGLQFKIGSGFSDHERKNPPPIGSIITYQYSGKTAKGVPRFASFLRIRHAPQLALNNKLSE